MYCLCDQRCNGRITCWNNKDTQEGEEKWFSLLLEELGAQVIKIKVHIHVAYHHIRHNFTTYKRLHMLSQKVREEKEKEKGIIKKGIQSSIIDQEKSKRNSMSSFYTCTTEDNDHLSLL